MDAATYSSLVNLGSKNCEVSEDDIARICETHRRFEDDPQSKVLPNAAFGYSKVAVCRPLRLAKLSPHVAYSPKELKLLRLPTPAGPSPVVVDPDADPVKIGYEVSFTRYFYKPPAQRTLAEIRADIVALERETDGLLAEIIGSAG